MIALFFTVGCGNDFIVDSYSGFIIVQKKTAHGGSVYIVQSLQKDTNFVYTFDYYSKKDFKVGDTIEFTVKEKK